MQFGFMLGGKNYRRIVCREKHAKEIYKLGEKLVFVDNAKSFVAVPRKMREKGLPEVILRAMMSFYHGPRQKLLSNQSYLKNF